MMYSTEWYWTSVCHAVHSTMAFASHPACAVFHLVAVGRRRLLPRVVRWKTCFLDLVYFEVPVVARTKGLASASSMASAVSEVCWLCHQKLDLGITNHDIILCVDTDVIQ